MFICFSFVDIRLYYLNCYQIDRLCFYLYKKKNKNKNKSKKRERQWNSLQNKREIEQTKAPTHWSQLEISSLCFEWKSHHHTETKISFPLIHAHYTSQHLFVQSPNFTSISFIEIKILESTKISIHSLLLSIVAIVGARFSVFLFFLQIKSSKYPEYVLAPFVECHI